jgi:hypothetical protein
LQARRELLSIVDEQARLLDYSAAARGLDGYYSRAITMLQSPKLREAFDLSAEPAYIREMYGRTSYGQSCLLARRLVEAGTKFVTVYFSDNIGGKRTDSGGWDTHGFDNTRMFPIVEKYHLPITEQTLPRCSTISINEVCLRRHWSFGWASSDALRTSTRMPAATIGRNATRPCSPVQG